MGLDVRALALMVSVTVVGCSLLAILLSVMQHHALKTSQDESYARSAAADLIWNLVPCCMMLLLMGTTLRAAWAN